MVVGCHWLLAARRTAIDVASVAHITSVRFLTILAPLGGRREHTPVAGHQIPRLRCFTVSAGDPNARIK